MSCLVWPMHTWNAMHAFSSSKSYTISVFYESIKNKRIWSVLMQLRSDQGIHPSVLVKIMYFFYQHKDKMVARCDSVSPIWGYRSPLAAKSKVGYRKRFAHVWARVRDAGPGWYPPDRDIGHLEGPSPRPSWMPNPIVILRRETSIHKYTHTR